MAQMGIPYALTGPDGTRVVFNDRSDPDFVGFLDGENGVTGLDGAEVRESAEELVEGDGGVHGDFYLGRRPITLQGILDPEPDPTAVNGRESRLKRAARALRSDSILRWQQSGRVETQLALRLQSRISITARRPKQFQIGMVSAEWRIVGSALQSANINLSGGGGGGSGLTFPMFVIPAPPPGGSIGFQFDFDFGNDPLGGIAQAYVENQGDAPAGPSFRIDGPVVNPQILNVTTGERIALDYSLGAGDYLLVDAATRTIKLNGTASRYAAFNYVQSRWWELQPGLNDLRILAASYSAPAAVTVYWRHSFN